jgi:two-component system CheB/CheR fusion protein
MLSDWNAPYIQALVKLIETQSKTTLAVWATDYAARVAKKSALPIVGIGASAGGLEALQGLLTNLPSDTGLAFVIIQHLAPGQVSMLTEILSRSTIMPVHKATQGVKIEPNKIYVIPPDNSMTIFEDTLQLHPRVQDMKGIDSFLDSLAVAKKTQAIGVILSGTGSDGTEGLKAIKAEGGLTFVQDPDTAQYPGMPQSAIAAETAYFILPPDKIAKELARIAKHPQIIRAEIIASQPKPIKEDNSKAIFTLLKTTFGVDFTHYKESTISRRIARRMVINQINGLSDYLAFLRSHPRELQALFDDMLIGVTSFFREPQTFEVMKEKIFPELIKDRSHENAIRIWVPGCSTGEEVYSIAITIQEFLEERNIPDQAVQIFGTDVNERNIEKARQGIYAKNIEAYISEKNLRKYFAKSNGNYQITKFIRDICIFAKQDVTKDPPFSNLDMICCRNVLIYFDSALQERVIPILHYALKPNGFLILGESESVGKFTDLFGAMEKKGVVFVKKRASTPVTFGFEAFQTVAKQHQVRETEKKDPIAILRDEVDKIVMSRYIPAMILINKNMDILIFRGYMAPYLLPESGTASLNVNKMIREELKLEIQTGIYRSKKEGRPVNIEGIEFGTNGDKKAVNIEIMPIRTRSFDETFYLVLFKESFAKSNVAYPEHAHPSEHLTDKESVSKDQQIQELREELDSTKQSLQTIIEEQEATNEELRAAMEEVQSSNEELQSTNEELETAKEELQSTNEELKTLNDELKNRNSDLARLNDDLTNLIKNIDMALIMVDNGLRVRRFTPLAQEIIGLIPTDVGRPITNIRLNIAVKEIEKLITEVITKLTTIKMDLQDNNGRWYELRIRPYITEEKRIDGAVISFIDIDEIKKAQQNKK